MLIKHLDYENKILKKQKFFIRDMLKRNLPYVFFLANGEPLLEAVAALPVLVLPFVWDAVVLRPISLNWLYVYHTLMIHHQFFVEP